MPRCSSCEQVFSLSTEELFWGAVLCCSCRKKELHFNGQVTLEASLARLAPAIAKAWVSELNAPLTPLDVGAKSQKSFFFTCSLCSSLLRASPGNLTRGKQVRCKGCSHRARGVANSRPRGLRVSDVPELLLLWDKERNDASPDSYSWKSNRKVYWLCAEGHSTYTSVYNRQQGRQCGVCRELCFVSRGERELSDFLRGCYSGPMELNRRGYIPPYELDVVLPEAGLAFEYNGTYFHSDAVIASKHSMSASTYHELKRTLAAQAGLLLLFVWEADWYNRKDEVHEALLDALAGKRKSPLLNKLEV